MSDDLGSDPGRPAVGSTEPGGKPPGVQDEAEWLAGLLRRDHAREYRLGPARSDRWTTEDAPGWVAELIRAVERAARAEDGDRPGGGQSSR